MTVNTPKITFSIIKDVGITFCSEIQEQSNCQKDFVIYCNERINAQGTPLLFEKRHKVESQSF